MSMKQIPQNVKFSARDQHCCDGFNIIQLYTMHTSQTTTNTPVTN